MGAKTAVLTGPRLRSDRGNRAKHYLVTREEDLGVLGAVGAGEQASQRTCGGSRARLIVVIRILKVPDRKAFPRPRLHQPRLSRPAPAGTHPERQIAGDTPS